MSAAAAFGKKEQIIYVRTVWKFHDFSITQILREINFGEFRSAKSAIWTDLEALNFDFYAFLHILEAKFLPNWQNSEKMAKTAV